MQLNWNCTLQLQSSCCRSSIKHASAVRVCLVSKTCSTGNVKINNRFHSPFFNPSQVFAESLVVISTAGHMASTSSEDSCSSSKTGKSHLPLTSSRAGQNASVWMKLRFVPTSIFVILAFAHVGYGDWEECELLEPSTTIIFHAAPRLRPKIKGLHTLCNYLCMILNWMRDVRPFSLSEKIAAQTSSEDRIKEVQASCHFEHFSQELMAAFIVTVLGKIDSQCHAFKPWIARNNVPMCQCALFLPFPAHLEAPPWPTLLHVS